MSTTKSEERKSRRSSILKAPKARQPLQNVELNASSVENSPATSTHKIKRRVSFAEKKHVKEFCDSMEQGTVWDSTYEENELSHRNSQNSNDENTATVEFPNESSKSHPRASIAAGISDESLLKFRHFSSSTANRSISDLNPTPTACEPAVEDSVFGTAPTRIPYPTNHFGSIKARRSLSMSECFAERNASEKKSSFRARAETCPATIDSRTRQALPDGQANLESATEAGEDRNDVVPMEETMIGDALVESRPFVETVPRASIIPFVDESPISDFPAIPSTGMVDSKLVEAIPSAGSMVDLKVDEETARTAKIFVEHDKFTIFHDTSMEITGAVSNLATARPAKSLSLESREDSSSVATEITTNGVKTLEFRDTLPKTDPGLTTVSIVSFTDRYSITNDPAISSAGVTVDSKLDEEVTRIAKNSVDHEKFTIFQDTSMEITEAVSNFATKKSGEESVVAAAESTMFGSKAEFTEPVCETAGPPSFDEFDPRERDLLREKWISHRDKSMDFTKVVRTTPGSGQPRDSSTERREIFIDKSGDVRDVVGNVAGIENPRKSLMERTKIFNDNSMEFTDAVGNVRIMKQREKSPTEKTKIFHDNSMEFTDAVGNVRIMKQREKSPSERTKIFHDNSMEFTVAVGDVQITKQRQLPMERPKVFHDESVDFTEVVGKVAGVENSRKSSTEKTKIFHDNSMEFTAAVGDVRITKQRQQLPMERTKVFHDESVDFTEVVGKVAGVENSRKSPTEKTKIFYNEYVDFTENVGKVAGVENARKSPTEKTKIFYNEYVDFTENVGKVAGVENAQKSAMEKTKIFYNEYVDFTENVGKVAGVENARKSPTEKTKIFYNEYVDFKENVGKVAAVENARKSPMEKTKIFYNEYVDFTENVGKVAGVENSRKSPTEKTKIFHDKSMEFTAGVQSARTTSQREKSPTERTKIFHNESIDFTEVVGNVPRTEDPRTSSTERTSKFNDKSVDFANIAMTVPGTKNSRKSRTERTTLFHDKSMEFTDAVRSVQSTKQRQKLPTERTTIFHNESVDFTEVVRNVPCTDERAKRESSPGRSTMFHNSPNFVEIVPGVRSAEKSIPDDPRPARSSTFRDRTEASVEFNSSIEKLRREDSLDRPETEERNVLQNRQPHDVPEVVQKILRAPKLSSRESNYALDVRMAIVAKTFVPPVQKPRSTDPELEIRSPLRKRIKSIGNKSIDLTAAVSFIKFGGKKTQSSDDGSTPTPEVVDERFSEETTHFRNESMEATEVAESFPRESHSARIFSPSSAEENPMFQGKEAEATFALRGSAGSDCDDDSYRLRNATLLDDASMEITGVIPGIVRAENIEIEDNPKTTIFHDQSMEMTVGVSRPAVPRFVPPSSETRLPDNGGARCIARDDSMELTGAVRPASSAEERIYAQEHEAVPWSNPTKFDQEGKTVFFRDDGMELTGAVGFNSRAAVPFADKENCPVGAEAFRPRGARLFEDESRIASKSEWLGKRKSLRCSSSQRNEEDLRVRAESEEQNRVENFGSDDVTGVVAFSSQINDNEYEGGTVERDYRISGNASGTLILGNETLEMTGIVPWSADLDVNRRSRPAGGTDDLPIVDKIHRRSSQSQVVKELFQKPLSSEVYTAEKMDPVSVNERTGTADLEAEIRKLAESFALEDESGFDQATFLRQQARCMEDYEANSTASQDCEPLAQSVRAIEQSASDESSDSEKSDDWERSPSTKNANASGRDVSPEVSQCFTSKSLEELRNRAYSVGKFQPETTGYELTAPMSVPSSDDFHRTIMLEDLQAVEPPSFLGDLADSMRSVGSTRELPTESGIDVKMADDAMPRVREAISRIWEDMPNVSLDTELTIPDITETVNMDGIADERRNENCGERMERKKMHRTQTCETNKPICDGWISALEINDEREKNHCRSSTGLTTADEFSSESADGPSEKLRRGESVLPTEGNVQTSTKFTDIDRSWNSKNFASSTVIVDDFTRQTMRRFVEKSSVILESSLSDELPSAITANEEENIGASICAEETAYDVAMEAEASLCKSPFESLQEIIKDLAGRSETIWTIIRFDEKTLAFNFFSNSIVLVIHFNETSNAIANPIKVIGFLSQLVEDGTDPGVSLAHSLIMKKVDSASLTRCYRTYEVIPQMLDFVTTEVKLGMDFMFELDRLRNLNVMEIYGNRIIFMVRTSDINAGIILKLTIEIKPFAEINSNDITISCILGSDKVRENDIKKLITNIKRDHRFLRFYMNDVKDYVDLMAETGFSASSRTGCD